MILFRVEVPENGLPTDDRGWGEIAEGGVEIHEIPGERQTVFELPNLSTLAKKFDTCLSRQAK
jgi:hypothetical protein